MPQPRVYEPTEVEVERIKMVLTDVFEGILRSSDDIGIVVQEDPDEVPEGRIIFQKLAPMADRWRVLVKKDLQDDKPGELTGPMLEVIQHGASFLAWHLAAKCYAEDVAAYQEQIQNN